MADLTVRLTEDAERFLQEERERAPRLDDDALICGAIAYAHWKMRQNDDPDSIEARLQLAGREYNRMGAS